MTASRTARCASLASIGLFVAVAAARAATYTVTTTADSGVGSLRQAVADANGNPGTDTIAFDIPGSGVQTITLASALTVTDSVLVDGYTQPGSSPNTDPIASNAVILVAIQGDGNNLGFDVTGGALEIHGVALNNFTTALFLTGAGGDFIGGCFIGPLPSGAAVSGSGTGILVGGAAADSIGDGTPANRNVISGNVYGLMIDSAAGTTMVLGNLIGTDATGTKALRNPLGSAADGIDGTKAVQIGGLAAGQGNVISGNGGSGIYFVGGPATVVGNIIGLDASGLLPLGNGQDGVYVNGDSPVIEANTISSNGGHGIELGDSAHALVAANFIGLNVNGGGELGNGGAGVYSGTTDDTWIGPQPGFAGNQIAHNGSGVWIGNPGSPRDFRLSENSIFQNGGAGIVDGAFASIQPNGSGGLNFPIITSVVPNASTTTIQGFYDNGPNQSVVVQFFSSPACSKKFPWQFDEGQTFLGAILTATDGTGHATFSWDAPIVVTDEVITASAMFDECVAGCAAAPDGSAVSWIQSGPFSQRLPFSISPFGGSPAGGTPIDIQGTNFEPGAAVTIGGQPVGALNIVSATEIQGTAPALPAGVAYAVTVVNPDGSRGTIPMAWLADFLDTPPENQFYDSVQPLVVSGVAAGIGGGNFGPDNATLRQQMAVFLLKGKHGICYVPPPCTGIFADVPCPSLFADWIEALEAEGITGGCGGGDYCPGATVRRDQMAAFLLKAEHGGAYVPPACSGIFTDVPCPSLFADWIEQLRMENITGGCGPSIYCPSNPNTRGQMAAFISATFGLFR